MTRSRKKCFWTISKAWDRFKERRFRKKTKQMVHELEKELVVNPDADFEEALNHKKMGEWGTKIGMEFDSCNERGHPKYSMTEEELKKIKEEGRRK